ncbi:chitinase [Wenjunlia tyrosinilytica]|nr:chitinase [Wenjunlia tyrosinilytica]
MSNHRRTVNRRAIAAIGVLVGGALAAGAAGILPGVALAHPPSAHKASVPKAGAQRATFAPYVDASLSPPFDLPSESKASRVKEYTLGFVNRGSGCVPQWSGTSSLDNPVAAKIGALRKAGGDVRVSFGGAAGAELATVCSNPTKLAAAYAKVVDRYKLTKLDFDIEGFALHMPDVTTRRSQALAKLQKDHPGLDITFTLPVLPNGLTPDGVKLLADAKGNGVRVSGVNIMAMDYGPSFKGDMGDLAIKAATATQGQLKSTLRLSDAAAWKALVVTPMIGVNDVQGETFTLQDARQLVTFAKSKHLRGLSMWSTTRDKQCPGGTKDQADPTCSGIVQKPLAFTKVFASYRG